MATYRDLDKSGTYRTVVIAMGPTFGNTRVPVALDTYFLGPGNYTWEPWITTLLVRQTISAPVSILLPNVAAWMNAIYGGTMLEVKDDAGVAGAANITLVPNGADIIIGPSVISQNLGALRISPLPDLTGWATLGGVKT